MGIDSPGASLKWQFKELLFLALQPWLHFAAEDAAWLRALCRTTAGTTNM